MGEKCGRGSRAEAKETSFHCYCTRPNRKTFMTPDSRIKPPDFLKQLNDKKEVSTVQQVSRSSNDWRLMRHVTILEEDTHGRDCE